MTVAYSRKQSRKDKNEGKKIYVTAIKLSIFRKLKEYNIPEKIIGTVGKKNRKGEHSNNCLFVWETVGCYRATKDCANLNRKK